MLHLVTNQIKKKKSYKHVAQQTLQLNIMPIAVTVYVFQIRYFSAQQHHRWWSVFYVIQSAVVFTLLVETNKLSLTSIPNKQSARSLKLSMLESYQISIRCPIHAQTTLYIVCKRARCFFALDGVIRIRIAAFRPNVHRTGGLAGGYMAFSAKCRGKAIANSGHMQTHTIY